MKILPPSLLVLSVAFICGCETVEVSPQDIADVRAGKKVLLETGHAGRALSFALNMPSISIKSVDGAPVTLPIYSKQQVPVLPGEHRVLLRCILQYRIDAKDSKPETVVDIDYQDTMTLTVTPGFKYQFSGQADIDAQTCRFDVAKVAFDFQ